MGTERFDAGVLTSVVNAVRWGADVQLTQHGTQGEQDPLHLRIGINVEGVIDEDGILQGDGVNIASGGGARPGRRDRKSMRLRDELAASDLMVSVTAERRSGSP